MITRMRTIEVEFELEKDDWLSDVYNATQHYAEVNNLDIFSEKLIRHDNGLPKKYNVTYTNPEIPWLSPEEPMDIIVTSKEV